MAYTKQTWSNGASGGTPVSAARLTHIEDGIESAAATADTAASAAGAAATTAAAALPKAGGTMTGELVAAGLRQDRVAAGTADAAATVTATTFTATGLEVPVTVGSSGRVKVTVTAEVRMTVGTGPVRIAPDLDEAAAANARSAASSSTDWTTVQRTCVITGLTPGEHTVRLAALVTTGGDTAEARFRSVVAEPI